jgi:hypothetical protein
MAASVSEAASFKGVDVLAGRDGAAGGACIFREALRMDHLAPSVNAEQALLLREYASLPIEVWMSEPVLHAKTPREKFRARRFASIPEMISWRLAG